MKKHLNSICSGAIVLALSISTLSCSKNNSLNSQTADDQTTVSLASGATSAESIYDDTFDVVTQSGEQTNISTLAILPASQTNRTIMRSLSSYPAVACAQVTLAPVDTNTFPKTMTIDYGSGCTSTNGITRKGKIVVSLTGKLRVPGSTISVSFDSYSVNGYTLTGTYSLTPATGTSGGINYNITINNGSITLPSGAVYTYTCSETFTQTGGIGTSTVTDDTYNITGNFSYSGGGLSIAGTITNPLVRAADCPNITSGTVAFVYKGINGVLDFGSGTCDNTATVTAGRTTETITLPR